MSKNSDGFENTEFDGRDYGQEHCESESYEITSNLQHDIHRNYRVPFSIEVDIPKGFQYDSKSDHSKLVYDISKLKFAQDKKRLPANIPGVEGAFEIELQFLKIEGFLHVYVNVPIAPKNSGNMCTMMHGDLSRLYASSQELVEIDCVMHVTGVNEKLPYFVLDCRHIEVQDFEVSPIAGNNKVKIQGQFKFLYETKSRDRNC
ncbi:hypothetical protein U0X36_05555 [Bacillus thuringiensis]|uniref:hypothetical protein n=1 Tax=Bacillus thuringiensis TaxID=1428 RepID=UPI000E4D000E|nr:hypothetical protein [Bacillus thuringiensis]MDZ3952409.1 hypothetical protein [Bacillus thuringiensis]RGP45229.1 hypothetical protein BTW32_26060 [Bacillus thuringiensis]